VVSRRAETVFAFVVAIAIGTLLVLVMSWLDEGRGPSVPLPTSSVESPR
jgi:hypothetical protein